MATVATNVARMGKKRKIIRRRPVTPREQFAATFRRLTDDMPLQRLADLLGVSVSTASAYRLGTRTPTFDDLPKIAEKLHLEDWLDFFRQD